MATLHPEVLKILKALLGIMDNLERALGSVESEGPQENALAEGIRSIHRQITDLLYSYGVRGFISVGTPFDPNRHEAVGQVHTSEIPANQVAEEFRRGYLIGDRLFRVAQVIVNTGIQVQEKVPLAWTAAGAGLRPRTQPIATRSATNRPSWLLNPPADTDTTVYLVGRSSNAGSVDEGKNEAGAAVLPELFRKLGALWSDHPVGPIYTLLANPLSRRVNVNAWIQLKSMLPELERWIEDLFWQQIESDISGKVYDVAILVGIPRCSLQELLDQHGPEERYARLSFVDVGPILRAILDGRGGALVCDVHTSGAASRTGIDPGDIIIKIGNRTMDSAALVRQTLTRLGHGRRLFEVEFVRSLEVLGTIRMGSPVTGWGRTLS